LPASSFGRAAGTARACGKAGLDRGRLRPEGSGFGVTFGIGARVFGCAVLLLLFMDLGAVFDFAAAFAFFVSLERSGRDGRVGFLVFFREPLLDRVGICFKK
jgi:hypothetical protein